MWRRARIPYQKALMAHESTTYGGNQSKGGKAKAIVNTPVKTSVQVGVEMKSRVTEVSTYNGRSWGNQVSMAEIADFQQCIENSGLIEMSKTGSKYTWRVGHEEDRIMPKIDWVFINIDWMNNMPNYKAQFLPKGICDHFPLKLCFSQVQRRRKPTFKYCNVWAYHPNFEYIVREGGINKYRDAICLELNTDEERLAIAQAQVALHNDPLNTQFQQTEREMLRSLDSPHTLQKFICSKGAKQLGLSSTKSCWGQKKRV
ncbi:hypothetical protein H5410_030029 [Solanum commersonii]|uniref:Uncharacterized protein n=1 Tax=Solanum commersonii TaxID=4109 RepID=A0A9J5YD46_SOLCO|nr:hypothetical protein H5410_030029 [Solanum commersonii]